MNTRRYVDQELRKYQALHRELEERLTALEYVVEGKHAAACASRNAAAAARRDRQLRARLPAGAVGTIVTQITEGDRLEARAAELRHRTRTLEANGKLF